jgi:hypothetical protein
MANIYRIEIQSKFSSKKHILYTAGNLELVADKAQAKPVTEEESLMVMENIDMEAVCYKEVS